MFKFNWTEISETVVSILKEYRAEQLQDEIQLRYYLQEYRTLGPEDALKNAKQVAEFYMKNKDKKFS